MSCRGSPPSASSKRQAADKEAHLNSPDLGGALVGPRAWRLLAPEHRQVQILVSDGLSAEAVHHNLPDLLPVLLDGLAGRKLEHGPADRWRATAG